MWRVALIWRPAALCGLAIALSVAVSAQPPAESPGAQPPAPAKPATDPLDRETPRGAVRGFLSAARSGNDELASQYLNLPAGARANTLARQLFVVLDARMPARLSQLSDAPEGSRANPLKPDQDTVARIQGGDGTIDIVLDRVTRDTGPPLWLFSDATLAVVPAVYDEVTLGWGDSALSVLLGLPVLYLITVFLNRILSPFISWLLRRLFKDTHFFVRNALPTPVRLMMLALSIQWVRSTLPLPLLVREFWSVTASLIMITAIIWLLILVNGRVEQYLRNRFPRANAPGASSLLRLGRRIVDLVLIIIGGLVMIRRLGVDPTPALAGLGVGGIAVALAAQKTLENVIAGASLIFDQAVRVGDFLKMDTVQGTVEHIGLRSTRIRTLERTIVSVPNGQIANASLETMSARDKFWFHPVVGLRYETTPQQLRAVVDGICRLLKENPAAEADTVRVRFIRLGQFSLDVDVSAYLIARDWNHFLELQERLLFAVTEIVQAAGTEIAFPSQTMYISNAQMAQTPEHPVTTR
jgi:MscS family membrane protein